MLHHLSLAVADLEVATAFYEAVFSPLGYVSVWTAETAVGFGPPGGGDKLALKLRPDRAPPTASGMHFAFAAPSQAAVREFHAAAIANGGRDLGAPGLRPDYGPNYYAAFVADPDGYWIEAVTRAD